MKFLTSLAFATTVFATESPLVHHGYTLDASGLFEYLDKLDNTQDNVI